MRAATFDLKLGTVGPEHVLVNGNDVTELVAGVSLLSQDGQPVVVRLGLKPGVEVSEIAGDGVVEVEPAGWDVATWLSRIDPIELDRRVCEAGFDVKPMEQALRVLQEMARGA